jgi:hypothetical protein
VTGEWVAFGIGVTFCLLYDIWVWLSGLAWRLKIKELVT